MPVIDEARELLKRRLGEIDEERKTVSRALDALSAPKRGRKPGKRGRPRKRGGNTRAEQAVALITAKPGISASDIAKEMKIKPNYLYRVLGDLEKNKRVKKKGRNYSPA